MACKVALKPWSQVHLHGVCSVRPTVRFRAVCSGKRAWKYRRYTSILGSWHTTFGSSASGLILPLMAAGNVVAGVQIPIILTRRLRSHVAKTHSAAAIVEEIATTSPMEPAQLEWAHNRQPFRLSQTTATERPGQIRAGHELWHKVVQS